MHLNRYICTGLLAAALLGACKRELYVNPDQYTKVYMPQATDYPAVHNLVMTDTAQHIIFGAACGGVDNQPRHITLRFKVDSALVDSFNIRNNTQYRLLPDSSYQLEALQATIAAGRFSSAPLRIALKTIGGMEPMVSYLLPLSIEQTEPALPLNEKLRTTWFLLKAAYQEADRTGWNVVEVSSEEAPNTGIKAWDNDLKTSWHTQWKNAKPAHPHYLVVDMDTTRVLHGFYTLPAQHATGNPQQVHIELSQDGEQWTPAGDFTFVNTYDKQYAYLDTPVATRYFKITVTASFSNTHFTHIAEWGAF